MFHIPLLLFIHHNINEDFFNVGRPLWLLSILRFLCHLIQISQHNCRDVNIYIYSSLNWPLHFYWKRNRDSILLKFSFLNVIVINVCHFEKQKTNGWTNKAKKCNSAICSALSVLFLFNAYYHIVSISKIKSSLIN